MSVRVGVTGSERRLGRVDHVDIILVISTASIIRVGEQAVEVVAVVLRPPIGLTCKMVGVRQTHTVVEGNGVVLLATATLTWIMIDV